MSETRYYLLVLETDLKLLQQGIITDSVQPSIATGLADLPGTKK